MKKDIYEMVTDRIIEQLEKGYIPWQKPWTGVHDGAYNRISKTALSQAKSGERRFAYTFSNAIRSAPLAMWMMPQRVKPFFKMTCCMMALSRCVSMRRCFVVCSQ